MFVLKRGRHQQIQRIYRRVQLVAHGCPSAKSKFWFHFETQTPQGFGICLSIPNENVQGLNGALEPYAGRETLSWDDRILPTDGLGNGMQWRSWLNNRTPGFQKMFHVGEVMEPKPI